MQRSVCSTLVTLHTTKLSLYAGSYTAKLTGSSLFSLSTLRAQVFTHFACFVSLYLSFLFCSPQCTFFSFLFYLFFYLPVFPLVSSVIFHVISSLYFYVCCYLFYFFLFSSLSFFHRVVYSLFPVIF